MAMVDVVGTLRRWCYVRGQLLRHPSRTRVVRRRAGLVTVALLTMVVSSGLLARPALAGAPPKLLDAPDPGFSAMRYVVIHNLYWDPKWDADNPSMPSREKLDDFTSQMVASPYLSLLSQYGFSAAAFNGSDQADSSCPAPSSMTLNYLVISGWILCEKHVLPSATTKGVNLWVVYAPTGYGASSCSNFNAFHALTLPSVVPPDSPQFFVIVLTQCGATSSGLDGTNLDATTRHAAHEIVEAITDPNPGAGWIDRSTFLPNGIVNLPSFGNLYTEGEASDICDNAEASLGIPGPPTGDLPRFGPDSMTPEGYAVDYYWSNSAGACVPTPGIWQPIAGPFVSNLAVARDIDGNPQVFARGSNNAMLFIGSGAQTPDGVWPGDWTTIAGPGDATLLGDPAAAANKSGSLEVFVRASASVPVTACFTTTLRGVTVKRCVPVSPLRYTSRQVLLHNWQGASDVWSGWGSLDGPNNSDLGSDPMVGVNLDGRLEVFALGSDNALYHIWQTCPGCGWSSWTRIDNAYPSNLTFVGRPAVGTNKDGRLEVVARGTDNALYHIWQCPQGKGCDWSAWTRIDSAQPSSLTFVGDPAIAANKIGSLEVFARGSDNALYHIWQTCPGCGWSGWSSLGGVLDGDPVASRDGAELIEVYVQGADNTNWHIAQQLTPSGTCCGWSSWTYSIGRFFVGNPALSLDTSNQLMVFIHGGHDTLYHS